MGLKSVLLALLSLTVAGQVACRQVEVQIRDVRVDAKDDRELFLRFKLDQDVKSLGSSNTFGYLRMLGPRSPESGQYHVVADLQGIPGAPGTYEYLCQFPLKAERPGTYYYIGQDGNPGSLTVELPNDLTQPGEHVLEFHVLGGGCGFFVTGVTSNVVGLVYKRP